MLKKFFSLAIVMAAVAGTAALLTATPAEAKSCPKGSHLVHCPGSNICCPDSHVCDCLP